MKSHMESEAEYRGKHPRCVRIYDVNFDGYRDVTQFDIDILMTAALNWATTREEVEKLADSVKERHATYREMTKNLFYVNPGEGA